MKKVLLLIFLTALSCLASANQLGKTIKLKSKYLGEREIVVSLPANYQQEPFYKFPVMYLTDAFSQFDHTASTIHYYSGGYSPMIVVGIYTQDRWGELKPYTEDKKINPKSELLRQFIIEEVKPYIEKHYRTEDYSIFAGHSLGGSFASHMYLQSASEFDLFLSFAANFAMGNEAMFDKMPAAFSKPNQPKIYFQFEQVSPFPTPLKSFHTLSSMLLDYPALTDTHRVQLLEGEDHMSVTHIGLIKAFNEIYRDWFLYIPPVLADKHAFEKHYETLSKRMGYTVKPTQSNLSEFVDILLSQKKIDAAEHVANQALKHYSQSHFSYSLLADVARIKGDRKDEIAQLNKAISLSGKDHERLSSYQQKLVEAKKLL